MNRFTRAIAASPCRLPASSTKNQTWYSRLWEDNQGHKAYTYPIMGGRGRKPVTNDASSSMDLAGIFQLLLVASGCIRCRLGQAVRIYGMNWQLPGCRDWRRGGNHMKNSL